MKTAIKPVNEAQRLREIQELNLLDTLPEREYDNLTKIAAEITLTPISLITVVDSNRQWFKSHHGLDATETHRELAFCAHAINTPTKILEVSDARQDSRFYDNPLVTDAPNVVFYAGMPLVTSTGAAIGTLCVIDHHPKKLTTKQKDALRALGDQVVQLLELRKKTIDLKATKASLVQQIEEFKKFADTTNLDVKSPLGNIVMISDVLISDYKSHLSRDAVTLLEDIKKSANHTRRYIDGLAAYNQIYKILQKKNTTCDLEKLIHAVWKNTNHSEKGVLKCVNCQKTITVKKDALAVILSELFSNALRFSKRNPRKVTVTYKDLKEHHQYIVGDNGPGFPKNTNEKDFPLFAKITYEDIYEVPCTGIGLPTAKKAAEGLGGHIVLTTSRPGTTEFTVTIPKE